ncbi:MAG: FAD binding domain-containing protein [Chloroflexi bacterium]|nr:FAD binding domain-containing protein [Chloroflexota bacterium]
MRRFDYAAPTEVFEACALLADRGDDARALAGGTDLIVQMRERDRRVPLVVSLRNLDGFKGIAQNADGSLTIGAMATGDEVNHSPLVQSQALFISEGAELLGSIQIRNRGTLGGNVGNAAPSADAAPPLVAAHATACIVGTKGTRDVLVGDLMTGPGQLALEPGELIQSFNVPAPQAHTGSRYVRHVPRREMDIAVVGIAALVTLEDDLETIKDASVVLSAVAPTWPHAITAEEVLRGQPVSEQLLAHAGEAAANDSQPISDVRASAAYRRMMVDVYTRRALTTAIERARAAS